jgi:2-isopropylmalate synthase
MVLEKNKILIYDTTLRDGEQSPGASMNPDQKLRMAVQLERLGVDIIEAGFPASSEGDLESIQRIAKKIRSAEIAAIARATIKDIDCAWQAIRGAAKPRIHVFFSSSDIHLKHQLKKTRSEALLHVKAAVQHACKYADNVEFSAVDATRAPEEFLCEMLQTAISSGAKTINIADTVGYAVPGEFGALIDYLFEKTQGIENVIFSVHCHDDLGLAVANTLAAVEHGVRQVKCTVNGIGERAGNAALEEVVMALHTRKNFFNAVTGIRIEHVYETSRLLTEITGIAVQPNKAVVGANAFAHESGIHQDGLLKEKRTYEIITPRSVGAPETRLVLGKHSGRHAVEARLKKLGYVLTSNELNKVFREFKEHAGLLTNVCDDDLEAIVRKEVFHADDAYSLIDLKVFTGSSSGSSVKLKIRVYAEVREEISSNPNHFEAVIAAIMKITGKNCRLMEYTGKTAISDNHVRGDTVVRLQYKEQVAAGSSSHPDIIVGFATACLKALNLIEWIRCDEKNRLMERRNRRLCV